MSIGGAGAASGRAATAPLLRVWRERAYLTQAELAERTGLGVRTIRRLEAGGAVRPRSHTVRLLAEALQLTSDEQDVLAAALHRAAGPDGAGGAAPRPAVAAIEVPRQLPASVPVFTGRQAELAGLAAVRAERTVVITAIDGMAGIGKTALAVYAAHSVAADYPDGQIFIDLRGHTIGLPPVEPGEALDRMLRALNVPGAEIPKQLDDRAALYRSRLADRRMLILLDNAGSEAQVAPLVPGTPGCMVLVTSRRRLTGLDRTHTVTLGVLPPADAVVLFTRVAGASRLAGESAEALLEVVELCGRLPLAVRVAAARLRSRAAWTVQNLIELLRDRRRRLGTLRAGGRSVAAALGLSYQQLSPDVQRAYRLLGLHPGEDLEVHAGAALIAGSTGRAEHMIDELVQANLLLEPEPGRYRFHNLVHMHAATVAAEDDAAGTARSSAGTRLLDYYCSAATRAMDVAYAFGWERRPRWPGGAPVDTPAPPDAASATAWLDVELHNLLAAAKHAAEHGEPRHAVHLAVTLHRHLRTRGRHLAARTLHEHALAAARSGTDPAGEAAVLGCLGQVLRLLGTRQQASECYERALRIAGERGQRVVEIDALIGLGDIDREVGRFDEATATFDRARALAHRSADRSGEFEALRRLGWTALALGEPAADRFEGALAIARDCGDPTSQLRALCALGHAHRLAGRPGQAADHFERALRVARSLEDRTAEVSCLIGLGRVHRLQDRHEPAAEAYREALVLARQIGSPHWQFEATYGMGRVHLGAGRPAEALGWHRAALDLATVLGRPAEQARALDGLAHAHLAAGRPEPARRHWREALDILTRLGVDATEDDTVSVAAIRGHLGGPDSSP